jgi:hypothetical protein
MRLLPWSVHYRCIGCARRFFDVGFSCLIGLSSF